MNVRIAPPRGMARPSSRVERTQQAFSFPAPTLGLVANGNIAVSQPGAAYILDNFHCTATGVAFRRGKLRYATLPGAARSLFSYKAGNLRRLFSATDAGIYDISVVMNPIDNALGTEAWVIAEDDDDYEIGWFALDGVDFYPATSGKWITAQTQASDGSSYLLGANGTDYTFVYDGQDFAAQVAGGTFVLAFEDEVAPFTSGETVTGSTSGATATILRVDSDGDAGRIWLSDIDNGPFEANEEITDGLGGEATTTSAENVVPGTNVSFAGGGLTTRSLSYVWAHKNRQFFIERESLNVWYTAAGAIAGELTQFSLGGQFKLGGYLVMGATWSRDTGSGLDAMCAFFSSEGEVAIYQGENPGEASTWRIVGVYRIGKPLGQKAIMEAGGDLFVATDIGLIPLSRALAADFAILGTEAVSEGIIDLWNQEVFARRGGEWSVALWSSRQRVMIPLPTINDQPPRWLVANAKTKAWSTYSGWDATCLHVFEDECYFGDEAGGIFLAEQSGTDDGASYSGTVLPAFDQMGAVGYKTVSMLRPVWRGPYRIRDKVTSRTDYDDSIPPAPNAIVPPGESIWGDGVWGSSTWSSSLVEKRIQQDWHVARGGGEVHSAIVQVTSGANAPIDPELIRIDALFTSGAVVN